MISAVLLLFTLSPAQAEEPTAETASVSLAGGKVKVKKDVVLVDDTAVATYRADPEARGSFTLVSLDETELLYFRWVTTPFQYMAAYTPDDRETPLFDADADMGFKGLIAKRLVQEGVLRKGGLDADALEAFAKKSGTQNTERAKRSGG